MQLEESACTTAHVFMGRSADDCQGQNEEQSIIMPEMRRRLCVVDQLHAKAFAVRANEKPSNGKKLKVYHCSLKGGRDFPPVFYGKFGTITLCIT